MSDAIRSARWLGASGIAAHASAPSLMGVESVGGFASAISGAPLSGRRLSAGLFFCLRTRFAASTCNAFGDAAEDVEQGEPDRRVSAVVGRGGIHVVAP